MSTKFPFVDYDPFFGGIIYNKIVPYQHFGKLVCPTCDPGEYFPILTSRTEVMPEVGAKELVKYFGPTGIKPFLVKIKVTHALDWKCTFTGGSNQEGCNQVRVRGEHIDEEELSFDVIFKVGMDEGCYKLACGNGFISVYGDYGSEKSVTLSKLSTVTGVFTGTCDGSGQEDYDYSSTADYVTKAKPVRLTGDSIYGDTGFLCKKDGEYRFSYSAKITTTKLGDAVIYLFTGDAEAWGIPFSFGYSGEPHVLTAQGVAGTLFGAEINFFIIWRDTYYYPNFCPDIEGNVASPPGALTLSGWSIEIDTT